MGYTHYWRQLRDFTDTEWQELTRLTKLITNGSQGILAHHPETAGEDDYYGEIEDDVFTIDNEEIRFNGIGKDSHETFRITKKKRPKADYEEQESYDRQGAFEFCKTAHKPYDKYVVAVLCAIYYIQDEKEVQPYESTYDKDGKWKGSKYRISFDDHIMDISSDGNSDDWKEGLFHAVGSTRVEEMYCPIRDCLTLSYVDYLDQKKKTG